MKYLATILFGTLLLISCGSDDSADTTTNPNNEQEQSNDNPAPVVDSNPQVEPENANITYEGNIKAIIDAKCTQCHAVMPVRSAPFGLTTFADVTVRNREERIGIRATAGTMPPVGSGETPLTTEEVRLINQWIEDGALER